VPRAGLIQRGRAKLFGHGEHALDAANSDRSLAPMESLAEGADVRAGLLGSPQQLMNAQWARAKSITLTYFLAALLPWLLAGFFLQ
jgi:hypothetical protein